MTYVLLVFTWIAPTAVNVTHIDGYRSLQACQAAQANVMAPPPMKVFSICIAGPDRGVF